MKLRHGLAFLFASAVVVGCVASALVVILQLMTEKAGEFESNGDNVTLLSVAGAFVRFAGLFGLGYLAIAGVVHVLLSRRPRVAALATALACSLAVGLPYLRLGQGLPLGPPLIAFVIVLAIQFLVSRFGPRPASP